MFRKYTLLDNNCQAFELPQVENVTQIKPVGRQAVGKDAARRASEWG
jgi:hypothetical protein